MYVYQYAIDLAPPQFTLSKQQQHHKQKHQQLNNQTTKQPTTATPPTPPPQQKQQYHQHQHSNTQVLSALLPLQNSGCFGDCLKMLEKLPKSKVLT
jgi:hypothetical protein